MGQLNYVYRYISNGKTVYVGITNNLKVRVKQHKGDKLHILQNPQIEYFCVSSRTDADILERYLINLYNTGEYFNVSKVIKSNDGPTFLEHVPFPWTQYSDDEPIKEVVFDIARILAAKEKTSHCVTENARVRKTSDIIRREIKDCREDIECIKKYIDGCDGREAEMGIMTKEVAQKDLFLHTKLCLLFEDLLKTFNKHSTKKLREILEEIKEVQCQIDMFYLLNFHTTKYVSPTQFVFNFTEGTIQTMNA